MQSVEKTPERSKHRYLRSHTQNDGYAKHEFPSGEIQHEASAT